MYSTARLPHNRYQIRGAMVAQQKGEMLISPMKLQIACSLYGTPYTTQELSNCVFIEQKEPVRTSSGLYIITYKSDLVPIAWRNGGANGFTLIFESWHR